MDTIELRKYQDENLWERTSGLLEFLSSVSSEVQKFEDATGFGLSYVIRPPEKIDGDAALTRNVGFLVVRRNKLFPERTYCLYSVLKNGVLHGYTGVYKEGVIATIRNLNPIDDFSSAKPVIYDWLRALMKDSCGKI